MTTALPDTDTDTDTDLDFTPRCCLTFIPLGMTGEPKPCENPARWVGRTPCCGHVGIVCEHHKHCNRRFQCGPCRRVFDDLVGWTRL